MCCSTAEWLLRELSASSDHPPSLPPSRDATEGLDSETSTSTFTIHPSDATKTPAYAPKDLRDPHTDKPIFLQPNGFHEMFEPHMLAYVFSVSYYCIWHILFSSLNAAADFDECVLFVNPARISPERLSVGDYKHLIWSGSKQNAVLSMLGAVTSCNIINSTTIGSHSYRAITIIPYAPSFAGFTNFLEKKYMCTDIFGPFEFGCLFTFSSRREGLSSSCLSACCSCPGFTADYLFNRWVCTSSSEY